MPLTSMKSLLHDAHTRRYAVGYFESWDQYSLEAVLDAAEESHSPVIVGFGGVMMEQGWFDNGGLCAQAAMGRALAERATVPVAFLLNEVATFEQIEHGLQWGFNAVMLDTCRLPYAENVAQTCRVVAAATAYGADVESEMDELPDASGTLADADTVARTDPEQAARFVAETGIAALAVAIGNVHILTTGQAEIDLDHLARLRAVVDVPFVVHGGTGFPAAAIPRAIELGVAKFNVGTVLKQRFFEGMRDAMAALPHVPDAQAIIGSRKAHDLCRAGKERMQAEVLSRMTLYGCVGKG